MANMAAADRQSNTLTRSVAGASDTLAGASDAVAGASDAVTGAPDAVAPSQKSTTDSAFAILNKCEQECNEKLKAIDEELSIYFELDMKQESFENHRKRLCELFKNTAAQTKEANQKLNFIRSQLIDLETETTSDTLIRSSDCDTLRNTTDNEQDAKIFETLRKRLRRLADNAFELNKQLQQLQIENNDLKNRLQMEKTFFERNGEVLKEIADLLCKVRGKQFSYNTIYSMEREENPFCKAILEITRDAQQREDKLSNILTEMKNKNHDLEETLQNYRKELRRHETERPNDSLQTQIEQLQCLLEEKDKRIVELNSMMGRLSQLQSESRRVEPLQSHKEEELRDLRSNLDQANHKLRCVMIDLTHSQKQERFLHSETRKLNDELIDLKRKHGDLTAHAQRLAGLLKTQENSRMDISKKYETVQQSCDDRTRKLHDADLQINTLKDRLAAMDQRYNELSIERNMLRDELLSLKEKEAEFFGKTRSLQEQLMKSEKELFTAHDVIKEQQCILQRNETAHIDATKRLQQTIKDLKRQYNILVDDYKALEDEYDKEKEAHRQSERVLESFRKWKESQVTADEATRCSFKQYEDHVKLLLEDKQRFLDKYRKLQEDFSVLQNELQRLKTGSTSNLTNTSEFSFMNRIEMIRRTSQRITEQTQALREDETTSAPPTASTTPTSNPTQNPNAR